MDYTLTVSDFEQEYNTFRSREKFLFDNGTHRFYYRWIVTVYTLQPGWADDYDTEYNISILVDKDSRHESKKDDTCERELYGFDMKYSKVRHKNYDEKYLNKLLEKACQIDIDKKLRKDKYKRIDAILNGGTFQVKFKY